MIVKLPPLLTPERISFKKKIESQKCVFDTLTSLLAKGQSEVSKNEIFDALIAREKLGNTCIGNGVAIPRAHLEITNPRIALLVLKNGLEINSVDKKPIKLFFAVLIPEKNSKGYSKLFSTLNNKLVTEESLETFTNTKNPELLANYFEKVIDSMEANEKEAS